MTEKKTLDAFVTEPELLEWLRIKKVNLDYIRRQKGLPFVEVTQKIRLYRIADLAEFFDGNVVQLQFRNKKGPESA